jgi:hypothetical protein
MGLSQAEYVEDFYAAVLIFPAFHPAHADWADRLARAVADHAASVGHGTVARTKRIPVEQRAEAARRRRKFDASQAVHRVADYIDDFSPLRRLPAFQHMENEVLAVLRDQPAGGAP